MGEGVTEGDQEVNMLSIFYPQVGDRVKLMNELMNGAAIGIVQEILESRNTLRPVGSMSSSGRILASVPQK